MAAKQINNLSGQFTILKSALEGLGIKIYQEMDDPLKGVVSTAQSMVQQLTDAFDADGFEGLVGAFGSALGQMVQMAANAAPELINAAVSLIHSFCDQIKTSANLLYESGAIGNLINSLVTGVINAAGDLYTAGIVIVANLLNGLADEAPAIADCAMGFILNLAEGLREWAPDIVDAAITITSTLVGALIENAPMLADAAISIAQAFSDALGDRFPGLSALLDGFLDGFVSTLSGVISSVVDLLSGIFSAIKGADPETMRSIGEAIGKIAAALVALSAAKPVISFIKNIASAFVSIGSTVKSVISFLSSTVGGISMVFGGAILAVTNFVDQFQNGFDAIKEILMLLGTAIAAVGAVILGAPAAVAAVVAGIVAAVATLVVLVKEHWDEIVSWFQSAREGAKGFFAALPSKVGAFFEGLFSSMHAFFSDVISGVTSFFGELPGRISEFFATVIASVGNFFSSLFASIGAFLSQLPYKVGYALGVVLSPCRRSKKSCTLAERSFEQMADKYVNATGVLAIKTWAEGKFATESDLDALSGRVDDIISDGGEPNTIESITVNGAPVAPDTQKNVALTVPTATSDLTNDGDGESNYATEAYVAANGGKIDKITVNGTEQTIANKTVALTVPTATSDLQNDSGYQNATEVQSLIDTAVTSAYKYKGSVANKAALPSSGNRAGDVYDTQDTGMNYAWNGTSWDALGQLVDTSALWTSVAGQANTLEAMTVAEINAILDPT